MPRCAFIVVVCKYTRLLAECMHSASIAPMRALHLRNVPDDVMERLEKLARAANTSVTAVAIRELAASTRRVDNATLLSALPDLGIATARIVEDVDTDRR